MAKIRSIEVHEFKHTAKDVGYDASRSWTYEPGSTLTATKHAVVIEDEDGVRGQYVPLWSSPSQAIQQTYGIAALIVGQDALERESIYDQAKRSLRKTDRIGFGVIDICLWDLAGKRAGMSVGHMLGGYRTSLPAYASTMQGDAHGGLGSAEEFVAFAEQCYDLGYRAFKNHQHTRDASEEARTVRLLADKVGDRMTLMNDLSCELNTLADAITVGRACDDAGFFWYEDPFADSSISQFGHKKLKEFIRTPLLITEHVRGVEPKADWLIAGATDFLRADPEIDMGITGAMKIAHIAEGFGVDVEFHGAGPAHRQCISAVRNSNFYELTLVHPILGNPMIPPIYADDYSDELDAVRSDGTFGVPEGPGLGVTYDWEYIAAHTSSVRTFTADDVQ